MAQEVALFSDEFERLMKNLDTSDFKIVLLIDIISGDDTSVLLLSVV